MLAFSIDIDPANANLTGFASNVTGAGPWAIPALTQTSGDDLAHQVSIRNDSSNDHSGKTVTLVGTDANGRAQTEVVTGPGASATVESSKYFLSLTSATPSATIGSDTFDIGWVDEVATKNYILDVDGGQAAILQSVVTGTINYDIETTLQRDGEGADQSASLWSDDAGFTNKTASVGPTALAGVRRCFRVVVNSYTDTAELQVYGIQATPARNT